MKMHFSDKHCNLPTEFRHSCIFPTEEITSTQKFDIAPKFPQNRQQILHF